MKKILVKEFPEFRKDRWDSSWEWKEYETPKGKGYVIKPHPHARGTAHPRYMSRWGFISLSPNLGLSPEEWRRTLPSVFLGEKRKTQRGEPFLALVKVIFEEPEVVLFASSTPVFLTEEREDLNTLTCMVSYGDDHTIGGSKAAWLGAYLIPIGSSVIVKERWEWRKPREWVGKKLFLATSEGMRPLQEN